MEKRAFRYLWLAQSISQVGDSLANYAVQATVVFRMHGTAREVSEVLIAGLLPRVLLGPFASVATDRYGPRRTMIAADLIRALLIATLMLAQTLPQFCGISFAVGCASAFFTPALVSAIPTLVSSEGLLRANARLQQSAHFARMASPVMAGALVASGLERTCYSVDSVSFLVSAALVAVFVGQLRETDSSQRMREPRTGVVRQFRSTIENTRTKTALLSMTIAVFATGCFSGLLPIFVRDSLRMGPSTYGTLGTLLAAGTLMGSLLLARHGRGWQSETWLHVGLSSVGIAIIALAAIPIPVIAYPAFVLIGASAAAAMTASATLLQITAAPEMRGRVAAVAASFTSFAQLAAMIGAAGVAAFLPVPAVYALSGLLLLSPLACRCFRR